MTGEKNRSHLGVVLCKKAPVLVPATTTIIFTTYNHNHHFYNIQPQLSFLQHTTTTTIFTTYNHNYHFYNIQPQLSFLQHTTTTTIFTTYNHNHHFYNIQLQPQPSFSQPTITTIILATFRFVAQLVPCIYPNISVMVDWTIQISYLAVPWQAVQQQQHEMLTADASKLTS